MQSWKLSLCIKKVSKLIQRTSGPFRCFLLSLRLLSESFMIKLWTYYQITMSSKNTLVCHTSMKKSQKVSILVSWPEWFLLICKRRLIQLTITFQFKKWLFWVVYFGEDKAKSILFSKKHRSKSIGQTDISCKDIKTKQYSKVPYFGCFGWMP